MIAGEVKYCDQSNRLLMDFDGRRNNLPPPYPLLIRYLRELHLSPIYASYQRSSTPKHWHIVIEVEEEISVMGRVFCQLYCGSDRWRERWTFLHVEQYKRKDKFVQVLFERKVEI